MFNNLREGVEMTYSLNKIEEDITKRTSETSETISNLPSLYINALLNTKLVGFLRINTNQSTELDQKHNAKAGTHKVVNRLLENSEYKELKKYRGYCSDLLKKYGEPYGFAWYSIPVCEYPLFVKEVEKLKLDFKEANEKFIKQYPQYRQQALQEVGDGIGIENFPKVSDIRNFNEIIFQQMPFPKNNYIVRLHEELMEDLRNGMDNYSKKLVVNTSISQLKTFADILRRFIDSCGYNEDGKRKRIVQTTFDCIAQQANKLKNFNVTNDSTINELIKKIDESLKGIDPEVLRNDDSARDDTANSLKNTLDLFGL